MAITRIVALFNLKPGVDVEVYEAWARAVDLPTVNTLPSVEKFEVFKATGVLGADSPAPYDYVEILDIRDMGQFGEDVSAPVMQAVAKDFSGMAETIFMLTRKLD